MLYRRSFFCVASASRALPARVSAALALFLVATAAGLFAPRAEAAAWYLGEIGTRSLARGGANVVNPQDPTAMWLNPAALARVRGVHVHLNVGQISLDSNFIRGCGPNDNCGPTDVDRTYRNGRRYRVQGGTCPPEDPVCDHGRAFPDPNGSVFEPREGQLGYFQDPASIPDGETIIDNTLASPLFTGGFWASASGASLGLSPALDGLAVGVAVYGPNAGNHAFPAEAVTRYSLISRDLLEIFYQGTIAYAYADWFAVGASLQGVTAGLTQRVALSSDFYGNEDPRYDVDVTLDAIQHFIPSANFGLWAQPLPGFELGASLQLGRNVRAEGPMTINRIGSRLQEEFIDSGIVAFDGEDTARTVAEFRLPPFYRFGARYQNHDRPYFGGWLSFDVEAAVVYEQWSTFDHNYLQVKGLDVSINGVSSPLEPVIIPRDWEDTVSLRLGGEVHVFHNILQLRGGAFYETNRDRLLAGEFGHGEGAIPNETYSTELVQAEKIGLGVGASIAYYGVRLDVGYAHMALVDRTIGDESIVHNNHIAPPLFNQEPRTRVAMGQYSASYNVLSLALNVAFDEVIGFGDFRDRPATVVGRPAEDPLF